MPCQYYEDEEIFNNQTCWDYRTDPNWKSFTTARDTIKSQKDNFPFLFQLNKTYIIEHLFTTEDDSDLACTFQELLTQPACGAHYDLEISL